jgi:hypothetical protein
MKLITGKETEYEEYKAKNNDPYGGEVVRYSEAWADLMEKSIEAGQTVEQCAKESSSKADTSGITGFMYGCAVKGLAYFWQHGEALRCWHNLDCQISDEGEKLNQSGGVLNPAILNIG